MARFWQQQGYRGDFCEKSLEASPVAERDNEKTNPPLVKAEPISDGGGTIVKKGKKLLRNNKRKR